MDERSDQLERRVSQIEERNARVEREKAWETSVARIFVVSVLTYFVAALAFWILGNQQFFLNALIPTAAFILSVQSVPFVRKWWIRKR